MSGWKWEELSSSEGGWGGKSTSCLQSCERDAQSQEVLPPRKEPCLEAAHVVRALEQRVVVPERGCSRKSVDLRGEGVTPQQRRGRAEVIPSEQLGYLRI